MAARMVVPAVKAHEILYALSRRHGRDLWFTEVKDGPTQTGMTQMDGLAVSRSWAHQCLTGYEVKVSRSDFMRDQKWPSYRDLTNVFSFACPVGIIQPEDIQDPTVGLVWYRPETGGLRTVRKPLFRPHDPDPLLLYYLLIYRVESDHHPFFGGGREMWREWLANRTSDWELGTRVKTGLTKRVTAPHRDLEVARAGAEVGQHARDRIDEIAKYLSARGVDAGELCVPWGNVGRVLEGVVGAGAPPAVLDSLERARNVIDHAIGHLRAIGTRADRDAERVVAE